MKCWLGLRATGTLINCWQKCKMVQLKNSLAAFFFFKLNTYLPYDPTILIIYPKEIKTCSQREMYPNVHNSFIHNGQKLETNVCGYL